MQGIVAKRPLDISIETVTLCNARCTFCAYNKVPRDKQIMTLELFDKICREYSLAGGGSLGFGPVMSDPLVDPMLFERIRLARTYPNLVLHAFTNGIRFAKLSDDQLLEFFSAMNVVNISLGGLTAEDYKAMFGVDKFDNVWSSLVRIHALIGKHDLPVRVQLHFRTFERERIVGHEKYKALIDMGFDCRDVITNYSDWGGVVSQDDLPDGASITWSDNSNARSPCIIAMTEFTVLPNGDVTACGCMDSNGEHTVGNVSTQGLTEVWTGEAYTAFRDSFPKGELFRICQKCTLYGPAEAVLSNRGLEDFDPSGEVFWLKLK